MGRRLLAALLAALPVLPAGAAQGGPLRLSARRGPHDDPGVVVISGGGAPGIARVWFGAEESPALAPWQGEGLSVVVPQGPAGKRVPVLAETGDGAVRRAGRFAYEGAIARGRSRARMSGELGCFEETGRRATFVGAATVSTVRRLPGGGFLYRYDFRNTLKGTVTVRWETLAPLGFTGGLGFFLASGERIRLARESEAPPVLVRGIATASALPGCSALDPEGDGGSWTSDAFLSSDELPAVAAVEGVAAAPVSASIVELSWQPAGGPAPDAYEVVARGVLDPIDFDAPPVDHDFRRFEVAAPATSIQLQPLPGANTLSVRALRGGVPSEAVVLTLVR